MGYRKLSIKEAVNYISEGRMFLPEIQRKFVWSEEQIENLFDSLLLGYPIGALLFWKTSKKILNNDDTALNLYEFIRDYHERDNKDNKKAPWPITSDFESYYIVLDGQQRLSSLYIAIKGSLSRKLPRHWRRNDNSFPKKELYMNLTVDPYVKIMDDDETKRFKFLTTSEFEKAPRNWFKVKDIFKYDEKSISKAKERCDNERARKNIDTLYAILTAGKEDCPLHFYEIDEADYDDVLNIFVRVNSSGTPLSKSDLLFSTIVSCWKGGREEIEKLINSMNGQGDKFAFGTDFVMRACLTLTDAPINLKINSFKRANVLKIQDNWEKIKTALLETTAFLVKCGFSDESITSYNALMPIAYYLYRGGQFTSENIAGFKKYFIIAQVKNIFGVASNTAINETRKALQNIENFKKGKFSMELFKDVRLTGDMNFTITDDVIEKCFEYDKGPYTFMLLTLLYPEIKVDAAVFHQDHVHPYVGFENKSLKKKGFPMETIEKWQVLRNKLPNLQLLQGAVNESKNDLPLVDWLKEPGNTIKYMPEGVSPDIKDFDTFYEKRKELMKAELKNVLGYTEATRVLR